jgi:hypothetical protein
MRVPNMRVPNMRVPNMRVPNNTIVPKKSNFRLYIVLILVMCLCVAMAGYYTLKIRPNGNMLQGHANGDWWGRSGGLGDPRGRPKQTIAQCRAYARKQGYPGVGYRTDAHASAVWRNTCFFYTKPDGGWQGNDVDKAHTTGCTNPGKSWGSC